MSSKYVCIISVYLHSIMVGVFVWGSLSSRKGLSELRRTELWQSLTLLYNLELEVLRFKTHRYIEDICVCDTGREDVV